MAFLQPAKNKATLHFCFLQTSLYCFLSPERTQKKVLLRSYKDNPKRDYGNCKKKKQERQREEQKVFNILPLQFRSLERGPLFSSPIYSSYSSKISSSLSTFERAFEAIRKNNRDYKETLKKYSLKSLKKMQVQVNRSVQFSILILKRSRNEMICNNIKKYYQ